MLFGGLSSSLWASSLLVPTMFGLVYDDDTLVSRVNFIVPKRMCIDAYSDKRMEIGPVRSPWSLP